MAQAMLAKELGLRRVFLVYEKGGDAKITYTDPFGRAARRLGVGVAGPAPYDPEAKSYDALAQRVAAPARRASSWPATPARRWQLAW